MALGGQPREIVCLILGQNVPVRAVGVAAGVLCAVTLSRVLYSLLWGVSAADPLTLAGSTVLLVLTGLVASLLLARQASALRSFGGSSHRVNSGRSRFGLASSTRTDSSGVVAGR
ncbi:hypothetical protein SBA3_600010 [Candidatus Sulfopaludibacter sp. SbA3]|nr:hypothetical protein SBA3_600010 [Candidatus Sulfopaludibacter sp. SbA3]